MALRLPSGLSPSKVESFTKCALAFRLSVIDRLPEPPSVAATRGTLVHRALEILYCLDPSGRTIDAGLEAVDAAFHDLRDDPDVVELGLDDTQAAAFIEEGRELVRRYFTLEDPTRIAPIGLELKLRASVGNLTLTGIIDRLELDGDGELVVTDYKTGRVPTQRYEQGRLGGVHFYALLCEQVLGRRPARVQLLYLSEPLAIIATPSERSIAGLTRKVGAVWSAVERACRAEDFRPSPGPLCGYCSYRAYCPAVGGNLELVAQASA